MGKGEKKRPGGSDLEDTTSGSSHRSVQEADINRNSFRGESGHKNERVEATNRSNNGASENRTVPEAQTHPDFGPYTTAVDELNQHIIASQKAMKHVGSLYTKHKRDIDEVTQTQEKLWEISLQCREYRTTIRTLKKLEKEKEEEVNRSIEDIEAQRLELARAKEKAEKREKEVNEDRAKFNKKTEDTEARQKSQLDELRKKLEKDQENKYRKRVEKSEKDAKEREDGYKKKIAELEAENERLSWKSKEDMEKLKQAETKCKDQEKLKTLYEGEAEKLSRDLKAAQNEFGLNTGTTNFYNGEFLKIYNDIQDISSRYLKELQVNDLKLIHDKMRNLDKHYAEIPISTSEVSKDLRIAHAQRVISSHLCSTIWQPFSSEIALGDGNYVSLLSQISKGLFTSRHGSSSGFHAARVCTALAIRGLQSNLHGGFSSASSSSLPTSPCRANIFAENVIAILSFLVKPSLHLSLRNRLIDLAHSAIAIWDTAQTDEREFTVHSALEVARTKEWRSPIFHKGARDEKSYTNDDEVFVLFPRVTARDSSRMTVARPTSLPGAWVESDPEPHIEENCIFNGVGLGKWSILVLEGEEEEEERKEEEERVKAEEKKMMVEEQLKNLEKKSKRRISHTKRGSTTESMSNHSNPTTTLEKRGEERIPEHKD